MMFFLFRLKTVSNWTFGISEVKKLSDHTGRTIMRTPMVWFSSLIHLTRKESTNVLRSFNHFWVKKVLLVYHSFVMLTSKTCNLLLRPKKSSTNYSWVLSKIELGTSRPAQPWPKKVSILSIWLLRSYLLLFSNLNWKLRNTD